MKKLFVALSCLLSVSCGRTVLDLASPPDGQTYQIEQFTTMDVQVANNEYEGITIEFRGQESIPDIRCDNTQNSPIARCYRNFAQNQIQNSFGMGCTSQAPCSVFILVRDSNNNTVVRSVKFIRGGQQAAPRPPGT